MPALAVLFVRDASAREFVLYKNFDVIRPVSEMFEWIPENRTSDQRNSKDLLMHQFSFPNYYLTGRDPSDILLHTDISNVISKGFIVHNGPDTFVLPLNTFDHD